MKEIFSRLNREWQITYYTDIILFVILIVTLVIAFKKRKHIPELKLIRIYLILFIALTASSYYSISTTQNKTDTLVYKSILPQEYGVAVIEFATFVFYALSITQIALHRILLKWLAGIIPAVFLIFYLLSFVDSVNSQYVVLHYMSLLEELGLLLTCVLYFIELFKNPPKHRLLDSPPFWIFSGLTFYSVCTLPITIIAPHLIIAQKDLYLRMFSTVYIFYIVLFGMIIKGYLCKQTI
ncbi:MAG: hypothetical protein EOO09_14455 [Chitinophagaceae bacterium]|nr:MAG: hypothetical protein EOO09_14455 [Chitinophagaceae bacterium]